VQVQNTSLEGQHLVQSYRLTALPAVLVLDPLTGAKLMERSGFVDAERLMEELLPFMDHGPKVGGGWAGLPSANSSDLMVTRSQSWD
jgi:hypothetical protein